MESVLQSNMVIPLSSPWSLSYKVMVYTSLFSMAILSYKVMVYTSHFSMLVCLTK